MRSRKQARLRLPSRTIVATLALLASLAGGMPAAQAAGGFGTAFEAALANDAEYRAARHELESREFNVPIARAGLLPSLGASYSESRVRGEREFVNAFGQPTTQDLDYRNPTKALQLRAPLLNLEAVGRYQSARSQVEGARSIFAARGHEMLDRLGTAYVQRLVAEAVVDLARSQVEAYQGQSVMAERRFAGGEGTRTEAAEAAASLAVAKAQLAEALDQREVAQRTLARITGLDEPPLRGLPHDAALRPLPHGEMRQWFETAAAQNPNLRARERILEAARHEVSRARAGHYPRVDVVASAADARNESISTLNQQTRQYSAGVQVNMPIFSGGGVDAGVSQALAEVSRNEAQLENDRRGLELDVRRQYLAIQTGLAKSGALKEAVASSEVALEGAQRGLTAGIRTTGDVLDAIRRLYQARRDFVQARYEVLMARLRLQALAGLPLPDIVEDIDRHLTTPAAGERSAFAVPPAPAVPPLPEARPAGTSATAQEEALLAAVEEWRAAWSARDADRYLAMYAPDFKPAGALSRDRWEKQRRDRLARAEFIDVQVEETRITPGTGQAMAEFAQTFRSDALREVGRKTLVLVERDGRWLIREESFAR